MRCNRHRILNKNTSETSLQKKLSSKQLAMLKKRKCIADMKMLHSGIEMFLMDSKLKAGINLNTRLLFERGYIPHIPECASGGKYYIKVTSKGEITISCTIHRDLDDTNGL